MGQLEKFEWGPWIGGWCCVDVDFPEWKGGTTEEYSCFVKVDREYLGVMGHDARKKDSLSLIYICMYIYTLTQIYLHTYIHI